MYLNIGSWVSQSIKFLTKRLISDLFYLNLFVCFTQATLIDCFAKKEIKLLHQQVCDRVIQYLILILSNRRYVQAPL